MKALRCAGFSKVELEVEGIGHRCFARPQLLTPCDGRAHGRSHSPAQQKNAPASSRVRELNFSLHGLAGFDRYAKIAGIVGTGKIGCIAARILKASLRKAYV